MTSVLPIIDGKWVRLRPLVQADLARRAVWTADEELTRLMGADPAEEPFVSMDDQLRRVREWFDDRSLHALALIAVDVGGVYIGDIDVHVEPGRPVAEISGFLGDRSSWGQGYGTEAMTLLLEWLRSVPAITTAQVQVANHNVRSQRFVEKLGFRQTNQTMTGKVYNRPL